jgi:hypothetical protein
MTIARFSHIAGALLAVALAGILAPRASFAGTITVPAAGYTIVAAGALNAYISSPGSVSNASCNGSYGCESSSASGAAGSVSVNGSSSGPIPPGAGGTANATVWFAVLGPPNVSVPLTIAGNASTSASGSVAYAYGYIEGTGGSLFTCSSTVANACNDTVGASGAIDQSFFLPSDTLGNYQLIATAALDGAGSVMATVDPIISINPAFLAANPGFSLVFSPSSIPEPSTWAMMALGFVGLGLAGWRRRADGIRVFG